MGIRGQERKLSVADDRSRLKAVLNSHTVMGLATLGENGPYSTPVFYALVDDGLTLLYMSKTSTKHSQHVIKNSRVSACVYVDAKEVSFLHGIQITGTVTSPEGNEQKKWRDIYCSVYPRARLTKFIGKRYRIYALHIETAKLTDNSLGFGKSFLWDFRPSRADGVRQDGARGP